MFFSLQDTEVLIPTSSIESSNEDGNAPAFDEDIKPLGTKTSVYAYPEDWINNFGNEYYRQAQLLELRTYTETGKWNSQADGTPYNPDPLQLTSTEEIQSGIASMLEEMKQEVQHEHKYDE